MTATSATALERVQKLDWSLIAESLWTSGFALTPPVFSAADCRTIAAYFNDETLFRKVIDMRAKHYGSGVYKYFNYPLPEPIEALRQEIYPHIAQIANEFHSALKLPQTFPATLSEFLKQCHAAGQTRPTPLVLHYDQGDFNCMHQDIYGDIAFPFQVTGFLSQSNEDYTGGEFLLQEQTFRMQPRVHVVKPQQGQLLIFTTRYRPERTSRGFKRVNVKHGVATIESGKRDTFGIIFHDAK